MKKTSTKVVAVCATLAFASVGSVLGAQVASAATPPTIAFSPLALSIPALKGLSEGVKHVGEMKGLKTIVLDPNFNAQKQVQQLEALLKAGKITQGWAISVKPAAMQGVARLAQQKKIPLVLNGVPKDYGFTGPQKGLSFARIDYGKVGAAVGTTLGQCINEKLGGKAEVIFASPTPGTAGEKEMSDAMTAWLKKTAPGATIVQETDTIDRVGAQKDVAAALQAHPNVKAVMGAIDQGALGALSAFEASGKSLPCLVDFGGDAEVLQLTKEGKIYATTALLFEADLMQTFDELARLSKSPTSVGKLMSVPLKIYKS